MKASSANLIRKKTGHSQLEFSARIGVSARTVNKWETYEQPDQLELPIPTAHMIRTTFQEEVLQDILSDWTDKVFKLMPSEVVAIWIVERSRCLLLPGGDRLAAVSSEKFLKNRKSESILFDPNKRRTVTTPIQIISIEGGGLVPQPLRNTRSLRLTGDEISNHPKKRHQGTRRENYFISETCESLVHTPAFEPGSFGPKPLYVLSCQNKLKPKGEYFELIKGGKDIYTLEDANLVQEFADGKMKEEISYWLKVLDMVPDDQGHPLSQT